MLFDRVLIRALRESIQFDEEGAFVWGAFEQLLAAALVERVASGDGVIQARHPPLPWRDLVAVQNRLRDMETIVWKLDRQLEWRRTDVLGRWEWMFFAASDVNAFLVFARALLDHLAKAIRLTAPRREGVPRTFSDLTKWVASKPADLVAETLGPMATVVADAEWFPELKDLRDQMIHDDLLTVVFPGTEDEPPIGIGVQLYRGTGPGRLSEPMLMQPDNPNIASFERIAVAVLARVQGLLNAAATVMAADATVLEDGLGGRRSHPALTVVARWADDALVKSDL